MEEINKQFSDKALKDFKLIDHAVNEGDEQAFAELMERYKRPVYHMILKMVLRLALQNPQQQAIAKAA